jgi:hypothetical protein
MIPVQGNLSLVPSLELRGCEGNGSVKLSYKLDVDKCDSKLLDLLERISVDF